MHRKRNTKTKTADISDDSEGEETKDGGFVLDPEEIFDDIPQPYRLIDKTLHFVFDKAWEVIKDLEIQRSELGVNGRIPLFDCARKIPDIFQPTLVCSSCDGKYTFLVTSTGVIHVVEATTSCVVATNEELQGSNVLSLSTSCLDGDKHFVCTLRDNGSAAIFAFSDGCLHLLKVFNEDSSVKNSITTYIQTSFDGNYVGIGWKIPLKSSWLDIYKVPKEFWISEIEIADKKAKKQLLQQEISINTDDETEKNNLTNTLENDSSDSENESVNSKKASQEQDGTHVGFVGETSFSKPTLILKMRSPTDPVPCHAGNASSALKLVDGDNNVIGTGSNHVLLQQYFDHSHAVFDHHHREYLQYLPEKVDDDLTSIPVIHFLKPGRFIPVGSENISDQANSVVVHWSANCHAFMYSLVKGSKTADVERKPDLVLTTSSRILVSADSVCKTMISFGLENNNIVTWDTLRGLPLNVINLPISATIISLHFIPAIKTKDTMIYQWKNTPSPAVKLLACSENGGLYMVEYNQEGEATVNNLYPSSFKVKDPIVQITPLLNLPKLVIIQRRSGSILIMDIFTNAPKCQIGLIKPLTMLQGFCYSHENCLLFIKGGLKDEYEEEIVPESVSVFTMNIEKFPVLKRYFEEIVDVHTGVCGPSLEKCIEEMETERIQTQENGRRHCCARWRQLEEELKHMKKTESLGDSIWFSTVVEA